MIGWTSLFLLMAVLYAAVTMQAATLGWVAEAKFYSVLTAAMAVAACGAAPKISV